jgi:hypothetical protein
MGGTNSTIQVNTPTTSGKLLAAFQYTDGSSNVVQSEAVTLVDSSGNEHVGSQASAASLPVVVASDQAAIPVTPSLERASAGAPVGVTVSTSAIVVLAANASAKSRLITNNGTTNIYLGRNNTVTSSGATMGILLSPGGSYNDSGVDLDQGAIWAIGSAVASSQNVSAWERT